jgi:hypothetical protein
MAGLWNKFFLILGSAAALAACGGAQTFGTPSGGAGAGSGGGAGSAGAGGGAGARSGEWVWQSRYGSEQTLNAVWASGPDDAWAGGDDGTMLHFDGSAWRPVASGTISHIQGIWGSSSRDVWAVAGGIGGPGAANIVHWNGSAWTPVASATPDNLYAIWGTGADDVWAVGASGVQGVVVHFDGHIWSSEWTSDSNAPHAISGSSSSNVWAVGALIYPTFGDQTLLRRSPGGAWTTFGSGEGEQQISGVWTASAEDAWAVGFGAMLHWNGQAWSEVASPIAAKLAALSGIWGTDASHVTAVGPNGIIVEWDGSRWTVLHSGGIGLAAIGGSDVQHRWAVGGTGTIFRYEPDLHGPLTCQGVQGQCVGVSACASGQGHLSDYSCSGAESVCCVAQAACGGVELPCCSPSGARSRPYCHDGAWACAGNASFCPMPPTPAG